jgi:hypothetical protein
MFLLPVARFFFLADGRFWLRNVFCNEIWVEGRRLFGMVLRGIWTSVVARVASSARGGFALNSMIVRSFTICYYS